MNNQTYFGRTTIIITYIIHLLYLNDDPQSSLEQQYCIIKSKCKFIKVFQFYDKYSLGLFFYEVQTLNANFIATLLKNMSMCQKRCMCTNLVR